MFSSRLPGLGGLDKVVSDWIKIQSFVSGQIRSFFLDVDGLKNFPWEILRLLFLNLDVVSIYLVNVITPRNMFINKFGSSCP